MMRLTALHRNLISLLGRHFDGVDVATFSIQYRLSPAQIQQAFVSLKRHELAELKGTKIRLTQKGRTWIQENPRFFEQNSKPWRQIPERFLRRRLEIDELYAPRQSLMRKRRRRRL